jgi:hypothetical protein
MAINVRRAVVQNTIWSRRLNWYGYQAQIETHIHAVTQNPPQFVQAVAQWQRNHQPGMDVDGIIGPNTWSVLRQEIGVASGTVQGAATVAVSAGSVSSGIGSIAGASISGESCSLSVRGHSVNFYCYINCSRFREKVQQLETFFSRVPDQHLSVLYPIFIMENKPGRGKGGGTWTHDLVQSQLTGTAQVRNTGIPAADIEHLVIRPGKGMIGIPAANWNVSIAELKFTVFHEVGHCIDFSFPPGGLVPSGARNADFEGMESEVRRCGSSDPLIRKAVEVYARHICSPYRIFYNQPPSETSAQANRRLLSTLRRSSAFSSVPSS